MTIQDLTQISQQFPSTKKMPVLFIGHGSPINGIEDSPYSQAWEQLGKTLPRPQAILSISAHWYTNGSFVHVAPSPRTIHDFYGFPEELYTISYPCPGSPEYAKETASLLSPTSVGLDDDWGIDHGTWIVLRRMYPNADIPVFQLSIDATLPADKHYALAQALQPLRHKGVLIMGSGNIVHNLSRVDFSPDAPAYAWARDFDEQAASLMMNGNHQALLAYNTLGEAAHLSIPTPDHYLPLIYALGAKEKTDNISFPVTGLAHGSVSMRSVLIS